MNQVQIDSYELLIENSIMENIINTYFFGEGCNIVTESSISDFAKKIKDWVIKTLSRLIDLMSRINSYMNKKFDELSEKAKNKYISKMYNTLTKNQNKYSKKTCKVGYSFSYDKYRVTEDRVKKFDESADSTINMLDTVCKEFPKLLTLDENKLKQGTEMFKKMFDTQNTYEFQQKFMMQYDSIAHTIVKKDDNYELTYKDAINAYEMYLSASKVVENLTKNIDRYKKSLITDKKLIQRSLDTESNDSIPSSAVIVKLYKEATEYVKTGINSTTELVNMLSKVCGDMTINMENGIGLCNRYYRRVTAKTKKIKLGGK